MERHPQSKRKRAASNTFEKLTIFLPLVEMKKEANEMPIMGLKIKKKGNGIIYIPIGKIIAVSWDEVRIGQVIIYLNGGSSKIFLVDELEEGSIDSLKKFCFMDKKK